MRIIPYSVSEIGYRGNVIDVNEILRTRFDQYPAVVLPMPEHDSTDGQGTGCNMPLVRNWYDIFTFICYKKVLCRSGDKWD